MHQHEIAGHDLLVLQHEETDLTLDSARLADALEIVNRLYLHGNGKAHFFAPSDRAFGTAKKILTPTDLKPGP
jgi:hypothetical protein